MKLGRVFAALLSFAILAPTSASADAAAPAIQCVGMGVTAPGQSFPVNTDAPIRLQIYGSDRQGFDAHEQPEVFIQVDSGAYEAVGFELDEDPNGGAFSRVLELINPQPGPYIVTWGDSDCEGMVSPVNASDIVVGSFRVTAEADLPTELGAIAMLEDETNGGPSPSWTGRFTVNLHDSTAPWRDVLQLGLDVGDTRVVPLRRYMLQNDQATVEYTHWCESAQVEPGMHEATVVAGINGEELSTDPVQIEIECLPAEERRACSVSAVESGTWLGVFVMFGLVMFRRRRLE